MAQETLNQKQLAERLGLTTRQVRNLVEKGLPTVADDGRVAYPWAEARDWYLDYKVETAVESVRPGDADEAKLRLTVAQARKAELEVAELESRLLDRSAVTDVVSDMAGRLRAALITLPATQSAPLERAGVPPVVAHQLLETIAQSLTRLLRDTAEDADG